MQRNKGKQLSVGPVLLGFFLFVVVGSGTKCLGAHQRLAGACQRHDWEDLSVLALILERIENTEPLLSLAALLQIIRTATAGNSIFH